MDKNNDTSMLLRLLVSMLERDFTISNLRIRRKEAELVLTDITKTFAWTLKHEGDAWYTEWSLHAPTLLTLLREPKNMIDAMHDAEQKMLVEFGTAAYELGGRLVVDGRQVYTDAETKAGIKTRAIGSWQTLLATLTGTIADQLRASLDFEVLFETYTNGKVLQVEQILGANRLAKNAFMGVMKIAQQNLNAPTQVQLIHQAAEDWEYQERVSKRVGYSQGLNRNNQWSDQKDNYIDTVVDTQDKTKPVTYSVISVVPFTLSVSAAGREAPVLHALERLVMMLLSRLPDEMTLDIREADPENKLPSYFVEYMTHGKVEGIESKVLAMLVSEITSMYLMGRTGDPDWMLRRLREAYDRIADDNEGAPKAMVEEGPHPTITAGLAPSNLKVRSVAFFAIGEQTAENFKVQIVGTGSTSLNLGQDFLDKAQQMGDHLMFAADAETKQVVSMAEYRVSVIEAFKSFQQHGKTQQINNRSAAFVILELLACALGDYPIEELPSRIRRSAIDRLLPVDPHTPTGREFVVKAPETQADAATAVEKKNRTSQLLESYILTGPPYAVRYVAQLDNLEFLEYVKRTTEEEREHAWTEMTDYASRWFNATYQSDILFLIQSLGDQAMDALTSIFRVYYTKGSTGFLKATDMGLAKKTARLAQVFIDCKEANVSDGYLRERIFDALRQTGEYAATAQEEAMQDHMEKIDKATGPVSQRDTDNIVRSAGRVFGPQQ